MQLKEKVIVKDLIGGIFKLMDITISKARRILKEDRIRLCHDSNPPNHLRFVIVNEAGEEVEVFRKFGLWSCNSSTIEVRNGKKHNYGCVMFTHVDKTKPFCSHTLSAELYLKKYFGERI
jgi:hypothetical protein